ncbi:MAG: iron-containing redox enzyme family protein [Leptolyngbyaceae cyanobacterium bins.302]|nr:iron-containing redox enzyme family protein [Leptolyngbyaceae cyanobacterium bins.302]
MQNTVMRPLSGGSGQTVMRETIAAPDYNLAEKLFIQLLHTEDLDRQIANQPDLIDEFQAALRIALAMAYTDQGDEAARLFLQRVLYRINRLSLFWYDDLQNYTNDRSLYIATVRDRIEADWQAWELAQVDVDALRQVDVKQALIERAEVDLDPPLSAEARFMREEMSYEGYQHLLAIASFDGLVEASRMTSVLGGAANEVQCTLVRVFLEEYGNGKLSRKHSTFFAKMMAEVGLDTQPEGYLNLVPWEVIACANHNFLLTQRKRHFLRYNGGLTYFEIAGPSIYRTYLTAAQRLGLSDTAAGYWELHIREDERHGRWMLDNVALPLAEQYPDHAWELVLGYDQEKMLGDRAGVAVVRSIRALEGR